MCSDTSCFAAKVSRYLKVEAAPKFLSSKQHHSTDEMLTQLVDDIMPGLAHTVWDAGILLSLYLEHELARKPVSMTPFLPFPLEINWIQRN